MQTIILVLLGLSALTVALAWVVAWDWARREVKK